MKKSMLLTFMLLFSFKTFAAGYGAAGCGIGSMVFEGKNEWYEQAMASFTNTALFSNQMFGITFGSLNCDANKLALKSERAKVFVAANKNSVVNELAMGQGETVSVLANIYNCKNSADFGGLMKSNYSQVISTADLTSEQIVQNIDKVVQTSNICQADLG